MNTRYTPSNVEWKIPKSIQFSILSTEEIKKHSVVKITSTDLFEKNVPKANGLYDLRMGTINRIYRCQTCNEDIINCQGHFGHMELAFPIYNISYLKTVYKILQCVCMNCSSFLGLSETYNKLDKSVSISKRMMRFKRVCEQLRKEQKCDVCEFVQPKWALDNLIINCHFQEGENEDEKMNSKVALSILRKISGDDCLRMGFDPFYSHPKNMIYEVLLVPPPVIRPSVMMDTMFRSQDDLSHKLLEILKCNHLLEKQSKVKGNSHVFNEYINLLQFHVNTFIDNELPGQPQATQRTGRPIKSICQRIRTKEGRVRGNIMGKRVDFSARTVITAEPNIMLDELGVPKNIAKNMTISENVTSYNKTFLQKCVTLGDEQNNVKDVGAKFVIHENGTRKDLRFTKDIQIVEGDVVERHLMDGDYVVFNRQPTLHKMSIMGHKVKVMNHNTFRLNLSATTPYNADFDGDEMNLHIPCSLESKAEVKELMMVSKCMVSPQSNKPVIGIVQDSLLACRLMSTRNVFLTKSDVSQLLLTINVFEIPHPCIVKPVKLWSGKQLFSLLFSRHTTMRKYSGWHDTSTQTPWFSSSDTEVYIDNEGELIMGTLCKKTLGASSCGIIHKTWLYDNTAACTLVSYIQFLVNHWLMDYGFSVGVQDCVNTPLVDKKVYQLVNDNIESIDIIIQNGQNKRKLPCTYENAINNKLNKARDSSGNCVKSQMNDKNNLYAMVSGGSKGSIINIAQIMSCVGQQNVNGQRISYGYLHRTLPHFKKHDNGPESRGFVKHSYMQGLAPSEFFFHAMGGREGVIDTAIKTSETGYIQRRLVKAMEDLKVGFDNIVRNSIGDIVQFSYGYDGLDGSLIFPQKCKSTNPWGYEVIHLPFSFENIANLSLTHSTDTTECYLFNNTVNPLLEWVIQDFEFTKQLPSPNSRWLRQTINQLIQTASICPGEMVGVVSAQSLGQPITQMTLNTFHSAGISAKNVTLGVPRLKELINLSKNIKCPSMTIVPRANCTAKLSPHYFIGSTMNMLVQNVSIHYNLKPMKFEEQYLNMMDNIDLYKSIQDTNWCICYEIDSNILGKQGISLIDITLSLHKFCDYIWCTCNDENDETVKIIVRLLTSNNGNDDYYKIKHLSNKLLKELYLKGYKNIKECFFENGVYETTGCDLENILCDPNIDPYKTISNNIIEIYQILGVEAARQALFNDLRMVIEFDGSYVDYRHIYLLVDTMTYKGCMMSITRHGINRTETGVLMRCSFEETINIITDAAIHAEIDHLKGVTEHIIMGKHPNVGTGFFDVLVNMNKVADLTLENEEFRPSSPFGGESVEYVQSYILKE